MALDDVYRYFRDWDRASFEVVACRGNEPTESDIAEFEAEVGFRLPDEFREFTMSPMGGLYMEVREELWPRPKPYDVGPFWSFLYGLKVFGIADGIPDWLNISVQHKELKADGGADLVPFLQLMGDPDKYCFNSAGRIVRWSHDDPENREFIPLAFGDLLMREIHGLEDRQRRKAGQVQESEERKAPDERN